MEKVPEMISTKDLSYIEDIFNWNFTACKKAIAFSEQVTDEDIANKLDDIHVMHLNICEKLVKILK